MISDFERAYEALNDQQRQAVDAIDGPLLVLAGPGTGKTQLLSTRAANIVRLGNATPENILCLTYTEAGAAEMRARLSRIMGAAGSEVAVFTFHGFGSWLISQYPDKFSAERALQPLDDLRRFQLLEGLLQALPLRHPLAVRDGDEHFIRQHAVSEAIQAFKQAGLTPPEIQKIIASNAGVYSAFEPLLADIFGSSLSAKRLPAIRATVEAFTEEQASSELLDALIGSLQTALSDSQTLGKTAPLGSWR